MIESTLIRDVLCILVRVAHTDNFFNLILNYYENVHMLLQSLSPFLEVHETLTMESDAFDGTVVVLDFTDFSFQYTTFGAQVGS